MSECDSPGTQGTEGQGGDLGSFRDDDSQMTNGDRSLNASTSSFQVWLASRNVSHACLYSEQIGGGPLYQARWPLASGICTCLGVDNVRMTWRLPLAATIYAGRSSQRGNPVGV